MLFETNDLHVEVELSGDCSLLVVTFTGRDRKPPAAGGAGATFFRKEGISAAHVISRANHWWNTPDFWPALAAVRELARAEGFREIVTYGSSMGGFGALLASGALAADRMVVSVPQYSIDPAKAPWEDRWLRDARKIDFAGEDLPNQIGRGKVIILSDPLYEPDQRHVAAIARHARVSRIDVPFAEHDVSRVLAELGLMREVTLDAIHDRYDASAFRGRLRAARGASALCWIGAARLLARRGNLRRAVEFGARAFQLLDAAPASAVRPEHERLVESHVEHLIAAGRGGDAIAVLDRWAARAAPGSGKLRLRALAHAALGDGPKALESMLGAVLARPTDRTMLGELASYAERFADPDRAVEIGTAARPALLGHVPTAMRYAKLLKVKGRAIEAASLVEEAAERFPADAEKLRAVAGS